MQINALSGIFLLFLVRRGACDYVDVEILDGFGRVRLELGSQQKFECQASGDYLNGSFIWSIGEEDLPGVIQRNKVNDEEDPEFWTQKSIVKFIVQKKHHDKKLICKYINILHDERAEILNEDSLSLGVYFLKVPDSVGLGLFDEGDDVTFEVEFSMFPRPEEGEVRWEMVEKDGSQEFFVPGERSQFGLYSAKSLEDLGQDRYKAAFKIVSVDLGENSKKFYLVVGKEDDRSRGTGKRRAPLDFRILPTTPMTVSVMQKESPLINGMKPKTSPPSISSFTPSYPDDRNTTPEPYTEDEIAELRVGIVSIIIVAILIVIIIFLVAYCLFCRKKEFTRVPAK
eukprot:TRINITY_DN278_c0_g2_i1.p1 TRINITY_DN278_c0_g2~~TRINITY_DN278_c0_g2_i1.p1  ORF type:complete len:341 (+),score=85.47 TRINITY_DN278_c0_g2_i1:401-1423(+)